MQYSSQIVRVSVISIEPDEVHLRRARIIIDIEAAKRLPGALTVIDPYRKKPIKRARPHLLPAARKRRQTRRRSSAAYVATKTPCGRRAAQGKHKIIDPPTPTQKASDLRRRLAAELAADELPHLHVAMKVGTT